jgi:glycosyltransferase involved in cell wall biosynthesis
MKPGKIGHDAPTCASMNATESHKGRFGRDRAGALLADFLRYEAQNAAELVDWLTPALGDAALAEGPRPARERLPELLRNAYETQGLFDPVFYRTTYMTGVLPSSEAEPIAHFIAEGRAKGFNPNSCFEMLEYLDQYPEILRAGLDPCLHYALFGWREGRNPGQCFDATFYLKANPDVIRAGISPLRHYLAWGRHEGRVPTPAAAIAAAEAAAQETVLIPPEEVLDPAASTGRGTILLVSHDAGVGGAQKVVQVLARWLRDRTRFDIRLVTMRGGGLMHAFEAVAPTLNLENLDPQQTAQTLEDFAGPDVKAVLLNSIASAGFLRHWARPTPVLNYIHELPKLLNAHPDEMALMRARATRVIAGSRAVETALRETFAIDADRLETVHGFIDDDLDAFSFDDKLAAKEALDIPADRVVVAACGVLHWRKSPEKFIEVAERVLALTDLPVQFIWVGGGPDHAACTALIREKGLESRVQITGYAPDVSRFLHAADIFLLPSEEDPFPLVCLIAERALCPVICFDEAGGIPELVGQGCGKAVPFGDVEAMAQATLRYINDAGQRRRDGLKGQQIVVSQYTITTTGPRLLAHIREAAGLAPEVSVVVPNYNYEAYLPQRLDSIARQSFQDFEVILLDDASPDGSMEVLREWARNRPATRLIANTENSGSPFAQWIKGMDLAQSELIWMAEADDFCEPDLLETLLPHFQRRNVFLGYVKSVPVNSAGEVLGDYETLYLNRINAGRWSAPYVVSDHEEASAGLGIANCIPNASSVIFRKFDAEEPFRSQVTGMRMCGDWLYYLRAMRGGMVAYCERPLNYHRRHASTVTSQTEGSMRYFDEFRDIRAYVAQTYRLSEAAQEKIGIFTQQDLDRFGVADPDTRNKILAGFSALEEKRSIPSVLFVASDLSPGGGQMFVIRLANAWAARGGRAILLNVEKFPTHAKVLSRIDPRVAAFTSRGADAGFLKRLCTRFDIDVIHSSIWWADKYVRQHIGDLPETGWAITMHGCYETILEDPQVDQDFPADVAFMRDRVDEWVHTADKNMAVFKAFGTPRQHRRLRNGVSVDLNRALSRNELGLREDAVVLCLATRAIESKGWFHAVEAVRALNARGSAVDLMLIGEGPAADSIIALSPEHVHLYGHVDNLHDYIATADIGILPSFFVGESMPLVLLEMMALGKPVVATDVGEIPDMVGYGEAAAGLLVPLHEGRLDTAAFTEAIQNLVNNTSLRLKLGAAARKRFQADYTIDAMVGAYARIYDAVLAREAARSGMANSA